jgi:serine/threonine protein kinase
LHNWLRRCTGAAVSSTHAPEHTTACARDAPHGLAFANLVAGDVPGVVAKISQCVEHALSLPTIPHAPREAAPDETMTNRALELSWDVPEKGQTIADKYVVEGPCGRGGLAVVLSAMHLGLDRRVAIKVLLPEWAGDGEVVRRFVREGRTATRIKSEHVVRVFDVGTLESGAPYLVLEYLEGHNLEDVVTNWGAVAVPTAVDWVLQAAEAIAEAHAHGIVHRDLKPANLFLTRRADGSACIKVIDFGLSKLTDPRLRGVPKITLPTDVMGSPQYMAPEQLRASCNADERADLWALGAVLHELITGHPPFGGETVAEVCATVLTQPTPRISSVRANVPPGLERAVMRCLEKEADARFTSVAEMAYAIAPFGTVVAGGCYERIARMAGPPAPPALPAPPSALSSEVTLPSLPSLPPPRDDGALARTSWPSDPHDWRFARRVAGADASARVVLGAMLILAGIGAGVFMFMYSSVHGIEPSNVGVTAQQPTSTTQTASASAQSASNNAQSPPSVTLTVLPPATASTPEAPPVAAAPPAPATLPPPVAGPSAPPPANDVGPSAPARAPAARPKPHLVFGERPDRATIPPPRPVAPPKAPHDPGVAPRRAPAVPAAVPTATPDEPPDRPTEDPSEQKPPPPGDDLFDGRK